MFSIFKKQEQKYIEPSELIAYAKIKKVLESCETIQQLSRTRCWMEQLYLTYKWAHDTYYHHLRAIFHTKWKEIVENTLEKTE